MDVLMALTARTVRRLGGITLAVLMSTAALGAPVSTAQVPAPAAAKVAVAAIPGTFGLEQQWGVQGHMKNGGTLNNSDVQAFTESRGRMFVGGNFARVQRGGNATGSDRVDQPYLAAFDADTATWVPGFRPTFNDQVHALATLPDGTVVVGGEFTRVNGTSSPGIVALDPITGAIRTDWQVNLEQRTKSPLMVRALEVDGSKLFIGGSFTHVSTGGFRGTSYARNVVQVSTGNPRVNNAFRPQPNGVVWSMSVSPNGNMLWIAGRFTKVVNPANGRLAEAMKVTGVRTSDGRQPSGMADPTFSARTKYQQAVEAVGDRVYYGGAEHMLFGVEADTFRRRSAHITNRGGDFQVIEAVSGGIILAGCHCYQYNYSDATTYPVGRNYSRMDRIKFVGAYDAATGRYLPDFVPTGVRTRNSHGAWAIEEGSNGDIWIGGDFVGIQMKPGRGTQWAGGFFRLPGA
jgi:hypothetical protein